uniref:Reverse transcriptase Ty1/copia-type domain-containing protein n=1 Tax=Chenopodium quinoa TaxID=63459 RepID=A0A803N1T9_CHEQI
MLSRVKSGKQTVVLVYVDDLLIIGDDEDYIVLFKKQLDKEFTIKDLGEMRYFLGLEVSNTCEGIILNQRKYVLDVLDFIGLSRCKLSLLQHPFLSM